MCLVGMQVRECGKTCGILTLHKPVFLQNFQECACYLIHAVVGSARLEIGAIVLPFGKGSNERSLRYVAQGLVAEGYSASGRHECGGIGGKAEIIAVDSSQTEVDEDAVDGLPMRSLVEQRAHAATAVADVHLHQLADAGTDHGLGALLLGA